MKREFTHLRNIICATVIAVVVTMLANPATSSAAEKPNIVLILSDDLGWGDLACYGHPVIKTPHLDRLAKEGLRFTNGYSAGANCSPSRAGLMTGRTPYRVGMHNQIPMLSPMHLRSEEVTIATLLRSAGYSTCHVGKWHLNGMFNLPGQPQPNDHGFDHWFSTQNNCLPNHHNPYNFVRNGIPVGPLAGYASQLVVDEATRWLREGRDKQKPFFLYMCLHEPHEPIASDPKYASLYDFPDDPSRVAHHGNITQMDAACGRLFAALDELKLADNTLVWFTSDNGPERTRWHNTGSPGPYREYKGNVYEGGIRVPLLVRWPGQIQPGTVSEEPACGTDFLPTVCAAVGITPPNDRVLDGANIVRLLKGGELHRTKPLYWQFNFTHTEPCLALRQGDWKIIARLNERPQRNASITELSNRLLKTAELTGFELYNLRSDIGEKTDLAASEPRRLREMTTLLTAQYEEIRRETPVWPLFNDPGYERDRIKWPDYIAKPLTKAAPR